MKYIVKNCPACYLVFKNLYACSDCKDNEMLECADCTDCMIKRVIALIIALRYVCPHSLLTVQGNDSKTIIHEILSMFEIVEVE